MWRRRRSRETVEPIPDQTLPWDSSLGIWGGTRRDALVHGDAEKIARLKLPPLDNLEELADLVRKPVSELQFLFHRDGKSRHYYAREIPKKSGGTRLLTIPLPRLKSVQSSILEKLVSRLPLQDSTHGFRAGRGVLSGASVHVGREVVICLDIKDFFPSFDARRVSGYFKNLGYSRGLSNAIAALTTASVWQASTPPDSGGKKEPANEPFGGHADFQAAGFKPGLPQGAPTSPGIANAICWRMDKRLCALARKFGGDYTRYADDLTFSGGDDMAAHASSLIAIVRKIVKTEGLTLNEKKTRVMRKGRQQRVTGVIVNQQTNVPRRDFDKLKAILHNCAKHGHAGQNRENHQDFEGHLRGRIAHATHIGPKRGAKLKAIFDRIGW